MNACAMGRGVAFSLWDHLFAYLSAEGNEIAMRCSVSDASALPTPTACCCGHASQPFGLLFSPGPLSRALLCRASPQSPLIECLFNAGRCMKTSLVPLSTMLLL